MENDTDIKVISIKSVLITDGRNPINLFGAANGLINPLTAQQVNQTQQVIEGNS